MTPEEPDIVEEHIELVADTTGPIVNDETRQEVAELVAAIRAMRPDPNEPCPPGWDADDRQGDRNIYRAAELLAAAYLVGKAR